MAWFNEDAAALLHEYAELTQITGGDVFRARNYEKAARSVRGWADDISQLDAKGLRAIPGVGASIAAKIAEYRETGRIGALDVLRAEIPPGVLELTKVPGLGPKRALQLSRDLGIGSAGHEVVAGGPAKTTVRTASGLTADLRVVPLDAWGAALQYFTGSAAHNVADFLAGFDLCVASVHSHFEQPRAEMTRRFIIACENPHVSVIGHPTTRRIGKRPPVEVDFGELFRACARTGTALEINASPQRLDLPSDHIRAARDAGVKFAIDSDAHSVSDLGNMPYGVGTAQRGWLTPDDVINTWPLDRLRAFLRKGRDS